MSLRNTKTKKVIFLTLAVILGLNLITAKADDAVDKLNADKTARQQKLQEINQQIKQYQQQIAQTQKASSSLKNEIFIYDKQIASTELQIQARQTQIEDTNLQIGELEKLIQQKILDIEKNKQILGQLIVELNESDSNYWLKAALGSNSFSAFMDQIQYTKSFQDKVYELLQKIKDLKAQLKSNQNNLKIQLANLEELKNQLQITQEALTTQRNQKQTLLNQTRGLEQNYQKLLTSSKKQEQDVQQEIADLDAQIRAKLGYRSIPAAKGVLAWPIDGILTQGYGNTGFTALGYTFHNGIDIAAPAGQPIYAAADGEVIYTDHSDAAYGNWVAILHNIATKGGNSQIITVYGHFRSFNASPGQKVKQGDLLGYEGNTGNTTRKLYGPERGYHLHFGVYDAEGFGVSDGKYANIYGPYKIPFGYTYNPLDFLQ
jgi:murein DD-endopeptidase MepM/ murein hydrolase activator NlpD